MYYYEILAGGQQYHGEGALTYSFNKQLAVGSIAAIPLRHKITAGIVVEKTSTPSFKTKSIDSVLTNDPLPATSLKLLAWMRDYYPSPLGSLVSLFAPTFLLRQTKNDLSTEHPIVSLDASGLPGLNKEQNRVVNSVRSQNTVDTILLHGDTGSGKTRVYIELALDQFQKNKSVMILTPEISLTPQLVKSFDMVFKNSVVVLHSNLSESKRRKSWFKIIRANRPLVVIGPRSALFSPLANIGLIVVDEAHEQSYKQEQLPRYHATRVAARLVQLNKAKLVLGSATPDVSDYFIIRAKGSPVLRMKELATGNKPSLKISIVPATERTRFSRDPNISDELLDSIKDSLGKHEQSLIFLNRRGTARTVVCMDCGWQAGCDNCGLPLTYHKDAHEMICHTCGFKSKAISICPKCNSSEITYRTAGTKAVVEILEKQFPGARIKRFDTDNNTSESLERNYEKIVRGDEDILVGTQLLGKGLDLPKLSLVGVISADTSLSFPDYTSEERTYQMITQIVGRVGRGHRPGKAIIQTARPDSPPILAAVNGQWNTFYKAQIKERQLFGFPPFSHVLKLACTRKSTASAAKASQALATQLGKLPGLEVMGPAPSFYEKGRNGYSWQIIVKSKSRASLTNIIGNLPSGWTYDLDPLNLL